jgi:hypothetical protein
MNEKEINEDFDREYERCSREHKEGFVKIKMPTYYIAKHSDEDLRAAVLAEREACAQLLNDWGKVNWNIWDCIKAIRARGDEMKDGIALASIAHPEGDPVPDDHEINPDSLETMEIDIPIDERIKALARQAGFTDFPDDKNGVWITDGYWDEQLERFAELVRQEEREQAEKQEKLCKDCGGIGRVVCDGRCMPEQEPWDTSDMAHRSSGLAIDDDDIQEYKRPWIGMSDVEIAIYSSGFSGTRLVREIVGLLKERNT